MDKYFLTGVHENKRLEEYFFYTSKDKYISYPYYGTDKKIVLDKINQRYKDFLEYKYPNSDIHDVKYDRMNITGNGNIMIPIYKCNPCVLSYTYNTSIEIYVNILNLVNIIHLKHITKMGKFEIDKEFIDSMYYTLQKNKKGEYTADFYVDFNKLV